MLSVEVVEGESGRQFHVRADSEDAERALRSFKRLFELIRLFRQLGTAQAIAVYINLFGGERIGMSWEEALDSALADSLADQLQVLDRDAQSFLYLYLVHAGDAGAFAKAADGLLAGLPRGRATSFRNTLTDGLPGMAISGTELATRLRADQPLALPRPSLFQRRLHDLMGERGL